MLHRGAEDHGKKLRKGCGKTVIDVEAWLSDDPLTHLKLKHLRKKKIPINKGT
jgi:hypothetical protein